MARTMIPTFIPTNTNSGTNGFLPLDAIPDEVKAEVEEIYAGLKAGANGRMRVAYDTVEELKTYTAQVTSYCAQRIDATTGEVAKIRFRKSPTRGLPDTAMDFRITDEKETPAVAPIAIPATAPVATPVSIPPKVGGKK